MIFWNIPSLTKTAIIIIILRVPRSITINFLKNSVVELDCCFAALTCPNTESYDGGGPENTTNDRHTVQGYLVCLCGCVCMRAGASLYWAVWEKHITDHVSCSFN